MARVSTTGDRPRLGHITHADGSETPVTFEAMPQPNCFMAMTLDGRHAVLGTDDEVTADVMNPDHHIYFGPGTHTG
jgi:hypothetical protein